MVILDIFTTGMDWFANFMGRNKLSIRKPEATSLARQSAFSKVAVDGFFTKLSDILLRLVWKLEFMFSHDPTTRYLQSHTL